MLKVKNRTSSLVDSDSKENSLKSDTEEIACMLKEMASKSKGQKSPPKPKTADQWGNAEYSISKNRIVAPERNEKTVAEISMKEFLDFLKISCQVNESIERNSSDRMEKMDVDWKKLTADDLINRLKGELKEREAAASVNDKLGRSKESAVTIQSPTADDVKVASTENKVGAERDKELTPKNSAEISIEKFNSNEAEMESSGSLQRESSTLSLDRKAVFEKEKRPNRRKMISYKMEGSIGSETSASYESIEDREPGKILKKKLNEVLQEGILDSILPYLIPKQQQQHPNQENSHSLAKKLSSTEVKKSAQGMGNVEKPSYLLPNKEKMDFKRKSTIYNDVEMMWDKKDKEVIIHVCDEIKNVKRDFKCSQKLLVSQMGYFAEVTNGQKLEDMDISVHCDVTIFDWLMRWVQRDYHNPKNWPVLDSSIVIPVLISSAFLQMDSLQDYCLQYSQLHINDIIRDSPNLNCINDNVLTRLANLFSNAEVESIIDKKDKIQSKLFCKLILALSEPEPQPQKGHFYSVATMYRCSKCFKLILKNMSGLVSCVANNMTMNPNGSTHSSHFYDSSWNLTDYVRDLKSELKTWRKVYWRLWSNCHSLYCEACEDFFPVHQMSWCRYHVDPVKYFHVENQKTTHPVGRYSCCGERAYRFEIIKKVSGCQYRDHVLNSNANETDVEILRIWNLFKNVIHCDPPPVMSHSRMGKLNGGEVRNPNRDDFWWDGLKLIPGKQAPGLLTKMWETVTKKEEFKTVKSVFECKSQKSPVTKSAGNSQSNIQDLSSLSDSSEESCSSSNAGNSEESFHSIATKSNLKSKNSSSSNQYVASTRLSVIRKGKEKKKRRKKNSVVKNEENRFWVSRLSTRSNQDNQRDFEERALRQIELILAKKLSGESFRAARCRSSQQIIPAGGIYVKLEQDWREAHCFSHGCPGSKVRGSNSYVNLNNQNSSTTQKRSKSKGHR